jgi:AraC-like DNA-binding protein
MTGQENIGSASVRPIRKWSTEDMRPSEAFDAWSEELSTTFLPWRPSEKSSGPFAATITSTRSDDISLIHCACDTNRGFRRRSEIGRTPDAWYAVLCVLSGQEVITIRDRQVILSAGNFLLWDSEEIMEYALLGPLEKATMFIPKARLSAAVPHVRRVIGKPFNRHPGVENLFHSHMRALVGEMDSLSVGELDRVLGVTLDLLARTTWSGLDGRSDSQVLTLMRVHQYIRQRLHDPDLSPPTIAEGCGLSLRTLHALFHTDGRTVGEWVRRERLESCKRDLLDPDSRTAISEIAYRWGFNDAAYFSRLFSHTYGEPPRALANRARKTLVS